MSSSSYPIKAIYDAAGTTVTGLGEFGPGDTIALDALPTGTTSNDVALGDHHHDTVYSKKPGSPTTVERVALFADTLGGLKQADVAFSALTQCSDKTTSNNLTVFSDTEGNIKDSSVALGSVVRGPDYATAQTAEALAVFSGAGNTIKKTALNTAGLVKIDGVGVPSSATKGSDYVEPGTATDFTKPQRPSIQTTSVAASGTVLWAVDSQVLHITSTGNYALTLPTVTQAMEGRSYRLVVTGVGTMTPSGAVKWQGGAPTLTSNYSKLDIFTFEVCMLSGSPYLVETGRLMNVG